MHVHDLIGIGFGPSNIALAIALQENQQAGRQLDAMFIEKQANFSWHPGMLLDHAHMQISYLKDLVTLRNPCSRFSFVNYLYEHGRLPAFINLKSFFPSRREFNDYLCWAARQFEDSCAYGEEVTAVLPEHQDGHVSLLRLRTQDASGNVKERLTRNLVIGVGGTVKIPACFQALAGNPRVFHSHHYLKAIAAHQDLHNVAVVGAGQSAAEIFMDLHDRKAPARIDLVMRAWAMRPSDDSPFINEVFNTEFTDHIFQRDEAGRAALLQEFRHTNYSVPDLELIQQIYKLFYEQEITRDRRHRLLRRHEVISANAHQDGIELTLRDLDREKELIHRYDAVVLATGYERETHKPLLAPLARYLGDFSVDRSYRIKASHDFSPGIFLQGACEGSHGLSDTLLSVTPIRVQEILRALQPPSSGKAGSETHAQVVIA